MKLLETFLLLAVIRILHARRIFEFGTFLGSTTFNLALNTPEDAEIFTLDLDEREAAGATQHSADVPLTEMHLEAKTLDFSGTAVSRKIQPVTGNSVSFDFSAWKNSIDLVFIDGGHDVTTLESDTCNALKMVRGDSTSCILWHDYGNPEYDGLTRWLDELSRRMGLFHIGDTMLCAWFNDPTGVILPHLVAEE